MKSKNNSPQTKPTDGEIVQPISSNLIIPSFKMDKTADNSPKSAGDDTLTSVRTTAKGIVRSKASIPNGAICKPETLSDTRIHTVEVDWGQMQNYVKIEDVKKIIWKRQQGVCGSAPDEIQDAKREELNAIAIELKDLAQKEKTQNG